MSDGRSKRAFTQTHSPWHDFFVVFDAQSLHGISQGDVGAVTIAFGALGDMHAATAGAIGATTIAIASTKLTSRRTMVARSRISIEAYYNTGDLGHP